MLTVYYGEGNLIPCASYLIIYPIKFYMIYF